MERCQFKSLSPETCKKSSQVILDDFEYHQSRGVREKAILAQTLSDASSKNTKVTVIHDMSKQIPGRLGLVALSLGELEVDDKKLPSIIIDYLFVDNRYRKTTYPHLFDRISKMLLIYAIQQAVEISKLAGARYLILRPDGGQENRNLVAFYKSMKFRYMTPKHKWMYLKLP